MSAGAPQPGGKICRGCLHVGDDMKYIFDGSLRDDFYTITNIEVCSWEGLPPWLCYACARETQRARRLRDRARRAHTFLLALYTQHAAQVELPFQVELERDRLRGGALALSRLEVWDSGDSTVPCLWGSASGIKVEPAAKMELREGAAGRDARLSLSAPDLWDSLSTREDGGEAGAELRGEESWQDEPGPSPPPPGEGLEEELKAEVKEEFDEFDEVPLVELSIAAGKGKRGKRKDRDREGRKKAKKKKKSADSKDADAEGGESGLMGGEEGTEKRRGPSSRMVLETEQYRVIKLTPEQVAAEREAALRSARFLAAPFQCLPCAKGFNYEDVLRNHNEKHQKKSGHLECSVCGQWVAGRVSLRGHLKSHCTKYQCKECGVVRASRQHLLEHHALQHGGAPRTYVCNVCGKTLTKRTMFQKHMRVHCPSSKVPCDKCGKLFKTMETLRAHTLRHADVKRYACEQCPKAFRYASLLYTHRVTHSSSREHYCVECDLRFKTASNLRLHLRKSRNHADPDLLKFRCEQCPRRYAEERALRHHVEWVHLRLKPHDCPQCGRQFGSRDGLRAHRRKVHEGVRPPRSHLCDICHKGFRAKAVLVKHLRVHTGERPFECPHCGKSFAQRSTMSTHVRLVHLKLKRERPKPSG